MATVLAHTTTATAAQAVPIVFGAAPVGGFTGEVELTAGTSATVTLQVRAHASAAWLDAYTFTLSSSGTTKYPAAVRNSYADAQWLVVAINGTVRLSAIGVGV